MTVDASATNTSSPDAGEAVETLNEAVAEASSETVQNAGKVYEKARDGAENALDTAIDKERDVLDSVSKAQKEVGAKLTPVPADFKATSSASDLKARLDWGEPALSIVDVRDRESFNNERIMGAMPVPMERLLETANTSFEPERDIFVYGDSDEAAFQAVTQLQSAGFNRVTLLEGGLSAWKSVDGATEGRATVPGLFDKGEGASIVGQTATP